jgi:hypothetical protein
MHYLCGSEGMKRSVPANGAAPHLPLFQGENSTVLNNLSTEYGAGEDDDSDDDDNDNDDNGDAAYTAAPRGRLMFLCYF